MLLEWRHVITPRTCAPAPLRVWQRISNLSPRRVRRGCARWSNCSTVFLHDTEERPAWNGAAARLAEALRGGRCQIQAATRSPTGKHLAISCEVRTLLRLRVSHVGAIYALGRETIIGRIARGKRRVKGWTEG